MRCVCIGRIPPLGQIPFLHQIRKRVKVFFGGPQKKTARKPGNYKVCVADRLLPLVRIPFLKQYRNLVKDYFLPGRTFFGEVDHYPQPVTPAPERSEGIVPGSAVWHKLQVPYYVYLLAKDYHGTLYTGVTNDLERRISEHKQKLVLGHTQKYNITRLAYSHF